MRALCCGTGLSGLCGSRSFHRRREACGPVFKPHEQRREGHAERRRHLGDVLEAKVALPALDRAHEGPVDPTVIGEGFLRIALLAPKFANALPQSLEQLVVKRLVHTSECSRADADTSTVFA